MVKRLSIADQEHERQLAAQVRLLDLTNDMIFVRGPQERITYWNRAAAETYGYSSEEALGKIPHELLHTEFPKPLEQILQALDSTGSWSGELIHTCRDGTRLTVSSRWVLERDEKGKPFSILETNNDITARKRSEENLRVAHAQLADFAGHLEKLVSQRTAKLQEMISELQHVSYA